ncbi:MAG: class I SAM-dependent methyltransferase [Pseudomonadota bacterium]
MSEEAHNADPMPFLFEEIDARHQEVLKSTITESSVDLKSLAYLYSLIKTVRPKNMLEIGLATGSSATCHALAALPTLSRFDIIDPMQGTLFDNVGLKNVRAVLSNSQEKLFFHLLPSYVAMTQLIETQIQYDYIFIDGDHRFDATMVDVFLADKLLKVGGYVVIDDRPWPMIGGVIAFMRENYRHMQADLRHPRLSTFRKLDIDRRQWFDFWHFNVPQDQQMQDKIAACQDARDRANREGDQ